MKILPPGAVDMDKHVGIKMWIMWISWWKDRIMGN
jgi:hypothetical protein